MNLANKLTIFRVILVPIMVIIPFFGIQGEIFGIPVTYVLVDIIFIIAAITDKLDGYIARSRNQVTAFGKFLDPLADKILVLAAMVMLVEIGKLPAWIPIIVLAREFIVSGYRLVAVEQGGTVIAASKWGKIKTVTQMIAIILAFVDKFNFFDFIHVTTNAEAVVEASSLIQMSQGEILLNGITSIVFVASVIATIFSGANYLKGAKKYLSK